MATHTQSPQLSHKIGLIYKLRRCHFTHMYLLLAVPLLQETAQPRAT